MKQISILVKSSVEGGQVKWSAGVSKGQDLKNGKTLFTFESVPVSTKENAWKTINARVQKIDFATFIVTFNGKNVKSLDEVQNQLDIL